MIRRTCEVADGFRRARLGVMVLLLFVPRPGHAAPGDGATPLVTREGDRIVWHRDAAPGEPPLVVQVVRHAMRAAGDTSLRDSDAALRILSAHRLAAGWALLRRGEIALAAGDSSRADSLLAAGERRFGLWQGDARRLRHDIALGRGDVRGALKIAQTAPARGPADGRGGEWEWLSARHLAALGDTAMAVRALEHMRARGTPQDSARRALELLDRLRAGPTGSAPGADERLAARLMADARDVRGQAERLERALRALESPRERFEASLELASAYRRTGRPAEARALLNALAAPADAPLAGETAARRDTIDRARRLVTLGDVERAAERPEAADRHYARAATLVAPAPGVSRGAAGYAVYREAIVDRADLAFSRGMTTRARDVFAAAPRFVPEHGAWQLRAGVLSVLLGQPRAAERHFAAADDGAFWLGVLRRRGARAAGDSLLRAVAGRDDFEFYAAAARESLGAPTRVVEPAGAAPRADGPAWLREAELLAWLGELDDAATLVERAIDWQTSVRAEGAPADMGFTVGRHWLRAARIAYLAGRPAIGIRLAHRPRWRMPHDLPAEVEREAVLPWLYPPAYDSLYAAYGAKSGVDPALLSAIGWQESFFDERAVSRAGALGVMQFMPATARLVARRLGEPPPSAADLLEAERSIRLGADYFRGLLLEFGGAVPPALAAYNAGPGRARTWIRRANGDRGALFCEVIGFDETVNYVKNILGAWQAYRWMRPRWE